MIAQALRTFPTTEHPMSHSTDLRSMGLKATTPRLKILELFSHSAVRHMTAETVQRQLQAEGIEIALATVYRVLTQFEQAGILKRHHFEADRAVYEYNEGEHHDHIVCIHCGKVEEFYDPEIERRQNEIAAERGFSIHDHALYIYATCLRGECAERRAATGDPAPMHGRDLQHHPHGLPPKKIG
jgi:Fur family transcriptional regulator, ferric uptake regulator